MTNFKARINLKYKIKFKIIVIFIKLINKYPKLKTE